MEHRVQKIVAIARHSLFTSLKKKLKKKKSKDKISYIFNMSVSKQQMLNNVSTLIREHVSSIKSEHATEMENLKNSHTT